MKNDKREIASQVEAHIAGAAAALGVDVVEVEVGGSLRHGLIRIYIDREGGVTLDDCADFSREIETLLEVEDPLPGSYALEVSSPGLNRPLRREEDFRRFEGEEVKIRTAKPVEGRRNFNGTLRGCDDGSVLLDLPSGSYRIPLGLVERARLNYKFE